MLVAAVLVLALIAEVVVVLLTVLGRATGWGVLRLAWSSQAGVLMLDILCFLGSAVGYRDHRFSSLDIIDRRLGRIGAARMDNAKDGYVLAFSIVLTYVGWHFAQQSWGQIDQYLNISQFWVNVTLPVGSAILAIFAIERLVRAGRQAWINVATGGVVLVLFLLEKTVLSGGLGQDSGRHLGVCTHAGSAGGRVAAALRLRHQRPDVQLFPAC